MEASNSTFEVILSNPGLQHIGENILKHLDIQSVAKCREVSSSFLDLIDGQKFWYIEQIKKYFFSPHEFNFEKILIGAFDHRKTLTELKIVAQFTTKYLAKKDFTNSLIYQAFKEGQIDFIKLFINSPLIDLAEMDHKGFTVFHHACSQGSKEVIELLIREFNNVDQTDGLINEVEAADSEWSDVSDEDDEEFDEAHENAIQHGNPSWAANFLYEELDR